MEPKSSSPHSQAHAEPAPSSPHPHMPQAFFIMLYKWEERRAFYVCVFCFVSARNKFLTERPIFVKVKLKAVSLHCSRRSNL